MKTCTIITCLACLSASVIATHTFAENWTEGMKKGQPELKSAGPLAFGPEGILLVADTKSAAIFAINTGDTSKKEGEQPLHIEGINNKIAGLLGTSADQILIEDMAVNPISRKVYLSVSRGRGPDASPALIRVMEGGKIEMVDLTSVSFSKAQLPDAPIDGVVGEGRRRSNPRQESITDVGFLEDRVLVAGLANEEFASTLRAIPFPFQTVPNGSTVEIFHGAHGRFETRAPVRTFVPFQVGDRPHLLAAYTCTPLVQFPVTDLEPGGKVRGKTIAELGNRNRPIDMIVYQKDGKDYLLLANSSRGVMKIQTDRIEEAGSIESRVEGETAGLNYETVDGWTGIDQLDKLDERMAVVMRQAGDNSLTLETLKLP